MQVCVCVCGGSLSSGSHCHAPRVNSSFSPSAPKHVGEIFRDTISGSSFSPCTLDSLLKGQWLHHKELREAFRKNNVSRCDGSRVLCTWP